MSILAIVLGVIGTIAAVLSILKMKLKDVIYTRSTIGLDTAELSTLRQVYDARVGIGLVIISGFLQIFCELYKEITCKVFWIISCIVVLLSIGYWFFMYSVFKNDETELLDQMEEELRNALIESIIKKKHFIKRKETIKYKKLINGIKGKNSFFDFETVNKCIDEIVSNKSKNEKIKEIKYLICHFEAISNKSRVYAIFAICFALLIEVFSYLIMQQFNLNFVGFVLGTVVIICIVAIRVLYRDYKECFVLKALNFKLDELNNKNMDNIESSDMDSYKER